MDINKIRQDFPILNAGEGHIYFDNACNTLRPKQVIEAIDEYYYKHPTCANRGAYKLAELTTRKVEEARKLIAGFIGASRHEEIIFTKNATEGINLIAHSFKLERGDTVLISDKEHNSNLVPWLKLVHSNGVYCKVVESNPDNTFNLENYQTALQDNVKLVAIGLTSNLDGATVPAKEIIRLAHENGALVLFDGAQALPHRKINVKELDVDFLAFSGHKMLGPSGIGVLYGKYALLNKLDTFILGGDTVVNTTYDSYELKPVPERFEAGLQNYAGIIGLGEAVKYLRQVGMENIIAHERELNAYITKELLSLQNINILGPKNAALRGGIISFYIDGMESHQAAITMDNAYNIMVRSGQHCVHSWFNARGIKNSIRASLYFYNTLEEAEVFVKAVYKICKLI